MNRKHLCVGLVMTVLVSLATMGVLAMNGKAGNGNFAFNPNSLVLSRSVYVGTAGTVTIGETLPRGCPGGANGRSNVQVPLTAGGTVTVAVPCGIAVDNGEAPNLLDDHNVWNNSGSDGSFGVTSPIFLDNLTTEGHLTIPISKAFSVSSH